MTLTIELPDMLATPLKAEAQAQGVSPDRYVYDILERALLTPSRAPLEPEAAGPAITPVWEMILDSVKDMPPEVFDRLPHDGAAEHDHYIYGTPKKYS